MPPVAVPRVSALPCGRAGHQWSGDGDGTYGSVVSPTAIQLGDYTCPPAVLTPKYGHSPWQTQHGNRGSAWGREVVLGYSWRNME